MCSEVFRIESDKPSLNYTVLYRKIKDNFVHEIALIGRKKAIEIVQILMGQRHKL